MKQIRSWMSHHPFKVVLFTFLFTLIPAIMAVTNDEFFFAGMAAFMIFVVVWAVSVWRFSKNIVTVLLVLAIMAAPLKQARAAMYGVAVIVVCVGGYCVYKVVRVCQKKFPPKTTNAPPEQFTGAESEYGGAYEYNSMGSCWTPPDLINASEEPANPTTFTLNVSLNPNGITTSMSANNEAGTAQDWEQFHLEMAEHGLFLTGHVSAPQFSLNRVPCDASLVPIEFDRSTGIVTQRTEGGLMRVVIERSPNLVEWYPLMQTDVGMGTGFQVVDTTREGQMFYRVQVIQP